MINWLAIAEKLKNNPSNDEVILGIIERPKPIKIDENKISVIHVVGPNPSDITNKGTFTSKFHRFKHKLYDAYNSVIDIFQNANTNKTLRLLPISGGIFRFKVNNYDELKTELSFKQDLNSSKMDDKMKEYYKKYPQTNEDILFKICNGYINAYNETNSGANVIIKDIKPLDTIEQDKIPSVDVLNTILLGLYTAECFIMSIFDLSNKNIEMCLDDKSANNELLLRVIFTEFINRGFLNEETQFD